MQQPFFSIITPTYNRAHIIGKTIRSVINQAFPNWELIIVDDGSTDNTKEVVSAFNDSRIKYIWQKNAERSTARNNGIALAQGAFTCFLDSDDIWRENHLAKLHQAIAANEFKPAIYFTGMCWNFENRKEDVVFDSPIGKNKIEYIIQHQIAPSTSCINTTILQKEKFNTALRINEDVELFARIADVVQLVQISDITVDFLIHNENTKATEKNIFSPQIKALNLIFNMPQLKNKISAEFKRDKLSGLQNALINQYLAAGDFKKMNIEIIRFLVWFPFHFQTKSKILLLLYHLPGGSFLQKIVAKLK